VALAADAGLPTTVVNSQHFADPHASAVALGLIAAD
jgi:hypothetical protein